MSTEPPTLISESNLSVAWARAFLSAMRRKSSLAPLTVSLGGFSGIPEEDLAIRHIIDGALARYKNTFSSTVSAFTIFPLKFWKMIGKPPCDELARQYLADIFPRMKKRGHSRNKYGTYFERMVDFHGLERDGVGFKPVVRNQLNHIISEWRRLAKTRRRPRQSSMVVSCFDPAKDHTHQTMRGFPCLQQVSFGYDNAGGLSVSAYYPTQYIFDRAYGNYLGLSHLGMFMATQLKLKLIRLNVFIGRPALGSIGKNQLGDVAGALEKRLAQIGKE